MATKVAQDGPGSGVAPGRQPGGAGAADDRRAVELAAREAAGQRLSRAERRMLTRERLLDAAAEVFNRLGYHGTSLEAVAAAAGYTKGAVYSNFATKGELFLALNRRYAQGRMEQQTQALDALSLDELADRAGELLVGQARTQEAWDLLQIEFWLAAMRDPELRTACRANDEDLWPELGRRFGDGFAALGVKPPFTGLEFAKLVNALGSGLMLQLYLDPDFIDPGLFGRAIRVLLGEREAVPEA